MLVTSSQVYSANSGEIEISRVEATDSFFTVYPSDTVFDSVGCDDHSKIVFWAEDAPVGHQKLMSITLSEMMSNKKVSMWIDGCKMGPWGKTLPKAGSINIVR